MTENIYVGRAKSTKFGMKLNICLDDMFSYAKENIDTAKNGKKYIRLDVVGLKEEDDKGNTHSVKIDQWKPE